MPARKTVWLALLLVAALAATAAVLWGCGGDDDDDDTGDDDGDDDEDDDDAGDDDLGDPGDVDTAYKSCDEIPLAEYGAPLYLETLLCDGEPMEAADQAFWDPRFGELTGVAIRSQAELDAILAGMEGYAPCPTDFAKSMILAVWDTVTSGGCSRIEICGAFQELMQITAVVFYDHCEGPEDVVTTPFHFVRIKPTDLDVRFVFHTWTHRED